MRHKLKSSISAIMLTSILGATSVCYGLDDDTNTTMQEVNKQTQELLQTIGSYTADKKDEAIQKAQQGLERLDERIDALEDRIDENWETMNEAARNEARENLRALRKQRNRVAEWYGSMQTSSAAAWDHVKKGFSDAYKALQNAWEKSEEEFSSNK